MDKIMRTMTEKDWDHTFLVDDLGLPTGRVHAVDLLKLINRKRINRDLAWMQAVPAIELVTQPPLSVRLKTPLIKAAALMLTHDLNQISVIDDDGCLVGYISQAIVARHLPRFLL